jgi:hypothetical protein
MNKKHKQAQAAAVIHLQAIIDEMARSAVAAQEMNATYKAFIQSQALTIQTLETELKIKQLEIDQLQRQLKQRKGRQ